MDIKKTAQSLHPYERRVLPEIKDGALVSELVQRTGLKEIEVVRALQWLDKKQAVKITIEPHERIFLDKNGIAYIKKGLPERRFLSALNDKEIALSKISEK